MNNAGFANISHNKNALLKKPIQFLLQRWPLRSFKVNDFHVVWKPMCDFLLVINGNLDCIYHRFRQMATYSFKHSIQNRGQTTANGHMVTIDSP